MRKHAAVTARAPALVNDVTTHVRLVLVVLRGQNAAPGDVTAWLALVVERTLLRHVADQCVNDVLNCL